MYMCTIENDYVCVKLTACTVLCLKSHFSVLSQQTAHSPSHPENSWRIKLWSSLQRRSEKMLGTGGICWNNSRGKA